MGITHLKLHIGRVSGFELIGLALQNTSQHQRTTSSHTAAQQGRQHLEGRGQNIGQHRLVHTLAHTRALFGQSRLQLHMVGLRVEQGRTHRIGVDVQRVDVLRAKLGRTNGQNARAAAVVQHASQALGVARDPTQTHAGGGMGAGAKSEPRVQADDGSGLRGRLMPGGHNPKRGGDVHRLELRLRQAHPVLLGHMLHAQHLTALKEVLRLQKHSRFLRGVFAGVQRNHARTLPTVFGRGHAGLAKERLLGIGLRIGVFHTHAQGVERIERVAQHFHPVLRAHQTKFKHQRLCWLSHSSR